MFAMWEFVPEQIRVFYCRTVTETKLAYMLELLGSLTRIHSLFFSHNKCTYDTHMHLHSFMLEGLHPATNLSYIDGYMSLYLRSKVCIWPSPWIRATREGITERLLTQEHTPHTPPLAVIPIASSIYPSYRYKYRLVRPTQAQLAERVGEAASWAGLQFELHLGAPLDRWQYLPC